MKLAIQQNLNEPFLGNVVARDVLNLISHQKRDGARFVKRKVPHQQRLIRHGKLLVATVLAIVCFCRRSNAKCFSCFKAGHPLPKTEMSDRLTRAGFTEAPEALLVL